jgi:hypothetical protein
LIHRPLQKSISRQWLSIAYRLMDMMYGNLHDPR